MICAGGGVEAGQHVEVDEAVVHRRDQRVGARVGEARVGRVGAGAVDDDVVGGGELGEGGGEALLLLGLGLGAAVERARLEHHPARHRQHHVVPAHVVLAVVEVAEEALLAQVEVERPDRVPGAHQRGDEVHGGGGLARAALLVAHHDQSRHGETLDNQMARPLGSAPPDLDDRADSRKQNSRLSSRTGASRPP